MASPTASIWPGRASIHWCARAGLRSWETARPRRSRRPGTHDLLARGQATLQRSFPQPHATFLAGVLLGADSSLQAGLEEAFNATGRAHIIAISG